METVIYMPLLGEGTGCWRPVRAARISEDIFKVIDRIRPDESWKFAEDSRVRCRNRIFAGGSSGLEAFQYAVESDPHYQLLKKNERNVFRVVFTDGEEAVVRVLHVDEQYEDFVYELLHPASAGRGSCRQSPAPRLRGRHRPGCSRHYRPASFRSPVE